MAPVVGQGVGVGDECSQLDLDRVGVLELVEQEVAVAVMEGGTHARAGSLVGERATCQHEQVVEAELSLSLTPGSRSDRSGTHYRDDPVDYLVGQMGHLCIEEGTGVLHLFSDIVDGDGACPVLLVAEPGAFGHHLAISQDPDRRKGVVGHRCQFVGVGLDQFQLDGHLVAGLDAVVAEVDEGSKGIDDGGDVDRYGIGGFNQAFLDLVPVLVETNDHPADVIERDAQLQPCQHRERQVLVVQQRVNEGVPALIEVDE